MDVVDNSLSSQRTQFGLGLSSFGAPERVLHAVDPGTCPCFHLRQAPLLLFHRASSYFFHAHLRTLAPAIRDDTALPVPPIVGWFSPPP